MKRATKASHYAVCVKNDGYEASLEKRKIYRLLPDRSAAHLGLVKVRDESGTPYLYPASLFVTIRLPQPVLKAFAHAA